MLQGQKRTKLSFILLFLITLLLSACSTQTSIKKIKDPSKTAYEEVSIKQTAEEKLTLAQSLNAQLANEEHPLPSQQSAVNTLLIEASELFLLQQDVSQALWLANEVTKLPQSNQHDTYRLLLVKAGSLLALNYHQQAFQQLQLANDLVIFANKNNTQPELKLTPGYFHILKDVLSKQSKPVLALAAQLNAFALTPNTANEDTLSIWQQLTTLTQWQTTQLVKQNPPFIEGWQRLLSYSHQFGADTEQFSHYLRLWQQDNPTHPANMIIAQLQQAYPLEEKFEAVTEGLIEGLTEGLTEEDKAIEEPVETKVEKKIENIAVLLPLSGNQQKAGLSAQQGILAAYKNNPSTNIDFIDTNKIDWENLPTRISELSIDHIIGPLLKSNVEKLLTVSIDNESLQVPTLLLNVPSQQPLASNQIALSMRPEEEAIQAAATLSQLNYTQPIVLSHQDRVSKRIAIAFRQQWQISTGESVDIVYFDQGKQMQASLKESLDVNASETRIQQLNGRLKHSIKSEPRNRRDIDMIYLVGTAAQTRLIKPYIDVNISPFADIIPVYSSSRSHSNFTDKNNPSSINDLQGLTFTQIPWLLTSSQQDIKLTNLSNKLWPKRTDSLSRIFAMGFDSYNLLGKAFLMQQAPYIRHFGQTGVLKLNNDNVLTRSLIWGQYKSNEVTQIALD